MNLSIEQMREIVEGAPSNIASHFCAGEYFERWSKYDWCRYVGDELVSCERPIDAINLADLRAAIASHDASIIPQDAAAPTVVEVPFFVWQKVGSSKPVNREELYLVARDGWHISAVWLDEFYSEGAEKTYPSGFYEPNGVHPLDKVTHFMRIEMPKEHGHD